jgi:uncharacterized RDD family membrane protein YckC
MTQIPAGWYPDPAPQTTPGRQRYWDGQQWTEHVHDPQPAAPPPPPAYAPAPPPAYASAYPPAYPSYASAPPAYAEPRSATTPDGVPLAGWWWRVLARLLDGFVMIPLYALAAAPVVASQWDSLRQWVDDVSYAADHDLPAPPTPDLFDVTSGPGIALWLSILGAVLVYEILFLFWKQATPGKLMVGLRVRLRESPELPASAIFARVGIVLVGQFCGLFTLVDDLWPLWDDKKQALHDKVARTNVVKPVRGSTPEQAAIEAAVRPRW